MLGVMQRGLLLLTGVLVAMAQPSFAWIQRFPDDGADFLYSNDVAIDASGDVFVGGAIVTSGTTNRMMVVKLGGAAGAEVWRRIFDPAP